MPIYRRLNEQARKQISLQPSYELFTTSYVHCIVVMFIFHNLSIKNTKFKE